MTILWVAGGAALGAPLRFACAQLLDDRWPGGTLLVNTLGSFLLGLCTALGLSGSTFALLGTGFAGALTTYSAFAVQTDERGGGPGAAYALLTLTLALTLCAGGFGLGVLATHA